MQVSAVLTSAQMLQSCPKSQLSLARQQAAPVGQARSDTTTMQSAVRKLMREVPLVLPGHIILLLCQNKCRNTETRLPRPRLRAPNVCFS